MRVGIGRPAPGWDMKDWVLAPYQTPELRKVMFDAYMNAADAVRFFKNSGAKAAVPYHVGMFDEKTPEIFDADNRIILEIYKETEV